MKRAKFGKEAWGFAVLLLIDFPTIVQGYFTGTGEIKLTGICSSFTGINRCLCLLIKIATTIAFCVCIASGQNTETNVGFGLLNGTQIYPLVST